MITAPQKMISIKITIAMIRPMETKMISQLILFSLGSVVRFTLCRKLHYESYDKPARGDAVNFPNRRGILPAAGNISQKGGLFFSSLALAADVLRGTHAKLTAETFSEVRQIPEASCKSHLAHRHLFFEQQL